MKPFVRAFVAVEIAPSIRSEARKALRPLFEAFPNVKWVDDDNFHVTLKFLGNVPTTELHRVVAAVERACADFEQFDLTFSGVGAFPNSANPRTVWIGVEDGVREIRALAERIESELAELGYPPERREFSPHLTVGRSRQKDRDDEDSGGLSGLSRTIAERANVFFGASPVDSVVVYSSELERGGPKYAPLAEIELSPLRVANDDADDFDPREFDDADELRELAETDMSAHLPEKLDKHFDFDALDDDVEAELRQICGDAFSRKPGGTDARKKQGDSNKKNRQGKSSDGGKEKLGKTDKAAKQGRKVVSKYDVSKNGKKTGTANAPILPAFDDVPELDDLDFSAFEEFKKR